MKTGEKPASFLMTGRLFAATLGLFALTLSASIAATYAWYTVRDFARIDRISMSLNDDSELLIGMKDESGVIQYGESLKDDDFRKVDENYDSNINLKDVSSMFSSQWLNENKDPDLKTPILRAPYGKSSSTTMTEAATGGYLQFATYFRSNVPCHLYLGPGTKATPIERWNKSIAGQNNWSEEELNHVLDCVRVSFYSKEGFYIAEPGQKASSHTKFGGPLQAKTLDGYYDYVDGKETMYGEFEGEPTYKPAPEQDVAEYEDDTAFHAKHKAGVEIVDPTSVTIAEEVTRPLNDFIFWKTATAGDAICLGTLTPDEDYRLVISVYLEGWDVDLTEALATGKFSLDLTFVGLMDI